MSDVLTRIDDFRSTPMLPPMWSTRKPPSQKTVKQLLEPPGAKPVSPVSPYPATNPPPEGMPYNSPAVLTVVSIWERLEKFYQALDEAMELLETMISEDEASPIDQQTFNYAMTVLRPLFMETEMLAPLVLPLQGGGIGVEWHDFGMNIELRFRNPYNVYAVLEDVGGVIQSFHGRDPYLMKSRAALREFSNRLR